MLSVKRYRNVYDDALEFLVDIVSAVKKDKAKPSVAGKLALVFGAFVKMVERAEDPAAKGWGISRERREERQNRLKTVLLELLKRTPPLLEGSTPEEHLASFHRFGAHAESLWRDAVVLYRAGSFSRACFLAITCLEEIGKGVIGRIEVKFESLGESFTHKPVEAGTRRENPFYDHSEKHFLAAASGALLNPRLDEILGADQVERILKTMESGELMEIRERCLYVDSTDQGLVWPAENITAETARKWIVVAGEIMLEVLGFPDSEWERMVPLVEEFESAVGIVPVTTSSG